MNAVSNGRDIQYQIVPTNNENIENQVKGNVCRTTDKLNKEAKSDDVKSDQKNTNKIQNLLNIFDCTKKDIELNC